jgi:hypothetical protein
LAAPSEHHAARSFHGSLPGLCVFGKIREIHRIEWHIRSFAALVVTRDAILIHEGSVLADEGCDWGGLQNE